MNLLTRRRIIRIQNNLPTYIPLAVVGIIVLCGLAMSLVELVYGRAWPWS